MVASAGAPSGGRVPVEVVEILVLEATSRRGCFIVHRDTLFPCVFQSYVIPNMSVWILTPSPNLGLDSYKNKKVDPYWKSQKQTVVRPTTHGFWRLQTVQWLPRTFIAFLGPSSLKMPNNLEVLSFNSNSSPPPRTFRNTRWDHGMWTLSSFQAWSTSFMGSTILREFHSFAETNHWGNLDLLHGYIHLAGGVRQDSNIFTGCEDLEAWVSAWVLIHHRFRTPSRALAPDRP